MTLNDVVKESFNCNNSYLQILFNVDTCDFQTFRHTGFYVNFQSRLSRYFTVFNTFKKLTRKELAQTVYDDLCSAGLSTQFFCKKYGKYINK